MNFLRMVGLAALVVLANLSTIAFAAEKSDGNWYQVGLHFGIDEDDVETDAEREVYASNYGSGITVSADVAIQIASRLYLHTALGLNYREYSYDGYTEFGCDGDCGGSWSGEDVNEFVYLEIPMLSQLRLPFMYLEAGPVVDLLIYSDEEHYMPEKYRGERCYEDKRYGVGVSAGIGHVFSFGLFVDAHVTYQFTDVVRGDKKCLTLRSVEQEMQMDVDGEVIESRVISESSEYVGGTYYKLLKYQLGVGYWF